MPAALSQLCQVLAQGAVRGAAARLACRATRGYAAQTAEAVVEASLPAAVEATQPRMSAKMAEAFDDDKHYGANNYKAIGPVYKSGKARCAGPMRVRVGGARRGGVKQASPPRFCFPALSARPGARARPVSDSAARRERGGRPRRPSGSG